MSPKKVKKTKKEIVKLRQHYRRLMNEVEINRERITVFRHLADIYKSFNEIFYISLQPFPLDELLNKILDIILSVPFLPLEKQGCLFLADRDNPGQLHLSIHRNLDDSLLKMCNKVAFGRCLCGKAAQDRRSIYKDCIGDEHENRPAGIKPHGHYIIPILSGDRVLGGLNLYVKHGHKPELHEMHFLQAVSDILSGIIARKQQEKQLSRMSFEDDLTSLPNRRLFFKQFEHALQRTKRSHDRIAVLYLDLDRFKPVNDIYGHYAGDLLLKEASQRMKSCLREMDILARIGGDEFVVLVELIKEPDEIANLKKRITHTIRQPFIIMGFRIEIDISIGISFYPDDGETCNELIKKADQSMYNAKTARTSQGTSEPVSLLSCRHKKASGN